MAPLLAAVQEPEVPVGVAVLVVLAVVVVVAFVVAIVRVVVVPGWLPHLPTLLMYWLKAGAQVRPLSW